MMGSEQMKTGDWRDDFDYHHRPFSPTGLVDVLNEAQRQWPGCLVGRSASGTGNLNVYTADGREYVARIEQHDPPELVVFETAFAV